MINIKEEKFLYSDKEDTFVVIVREYYLFKWLFMKKESHDYNIRLIGEYTPMPKQKKQKPIGFVINNKKKKKNENKSKAS